MWLTQKLQTQNDTATVTEGQVSTADQLTVTGESVHVAPQQLSPYGYAALPPAGSQAVLVGGLCAGIAAVQDTRLAPGEVCLFSSGGAEILLKNDGTVVINGQVFERK